MDDLESPERAQSPETPDADPGDGAGTVLWIVPLLIAVLLVALAWGAIVSANRPPSGEVAAPSPTTTPATAPPGGPADAAARGEKVFKGTCAACHGPDAKGLPGLGKNLHNNAFVQSLSDDELVVFIETGRPVDDPANTTGVAMPPKGGNPALSEQDLRDVVAFLRTLQ